MVTNSQTAASFDHEPAVADVQVVFHDRSSTVLPMAGGGWRQQCYRRKTAMRTVEQAICSCCDGYTGTCDAGGLTGWHVLNLPKPVSHKYALMNILEITLTPTRTIQHVYACVPICGRSA